MNGIDAKINFVLLNSKGEMEFKCNSLEDSREELRKFKLRFQ
jgi:hypothetical protein